MGIDGRVGMEAKAVNRIAALAFGEWDFLLVAKAAADAIYFLRQIAL